MGLDTAGHRLFVATLGNDSVAVISLQAGKLVHSITGLSQPQGVAFVPGANLLYVSNAGNGAVDVYNSASYQKVKSVPLGSDADNIRYDPVAKLLYVGYGGGAIAVINATSGEKVGSLNVGAHPEGFQLEKSGPRIFVNAPSENNAVLVLDRGKNSTVATWSPGNSSENFPMALDEANHRLFVGTRSPARLVVMDTDSGALVASVGIPQDPDDVFYNAANGCLYVSSGEGYLTVIKQASADQYQPVAKIPTSSGARTSLFSPELGQLYVAVPQSGSADARILVYQAPTA
jgi:DNA-binding beta-propeller fold protein YncE